MARATLIRVARDLDACGQSFGKRSGYLDLSAGFLIERSSHGPGGVRIIEQARLCEVSAVAIGAYEDAQVLAVRHAQTTRPARRRELWETPSRWTV